MKLKIEIDMSNGAFDDLKYGEVASLLRAIVSRDDLPETLEYGGKFKLRDSNGNTVGFVKVVEE